jgi:hypothetical protein
MKYEIMTCNGKAISKVIGWGMILNMIRDKNGTPKYTWRSPHSLCPATTVCCPTPIVFCPFTATKLYHLRHLSSTGP